MAFNAPSSPASLMIDLAGGKSLLAGELVDHAVKTPDPPDDPNAAREFFYVDDEALMERYRIYRELYRSPS